MQIEAMERLAALVCHPESMEERESLAVVSISPVPCLAIFTKTIWTKCFKYLDLIR